MRHGFGGWRQVSWAGGLAAAALAAPLTLLGPQLVAGLPVCLVLAWLAGRQMSSLGTAVAVLVASAVAALLLPLTWDARSLASVGVSVLLVQLLAAVLPWWLGRSRRLRLEQAARERWLIEEQARSSERHRIARDMHDSLGHELALIALQSGALELSAQTAEQRASAAAVRAGAVAATDRLHRILGLMTGPATTPPGTPVPDDHPAADDTDVAGLVDRARRGGMVVELSWEEGGALPAQERTAWSTETSRAVARVVQEALTNAAKHAPGSRVRVVVADADPVGVEVVSVGGTDAHTSRDGGRGLLAMDERLRLLGGRLVATRTGDGYRVAATLPRRAQVDTTVAPGLAVGLQDLRRQGRRGRFRAGLLPGALTLGVSAVLFSAHAVTVIQTALPPERYAQIEIGRTRAEIAPLLPPRSQSQPPPVLGVPPAPDATTCSYYQARSSVLDLGPDMFRLCFQEVPGPGAVLVAKDRLVPTRGDR